MKYEDFSISIYCKGDIEHIKLFFEEVKEVIGQKPESIYFGDPSLDPEYSDNCMNLYLPNYECDGELCDIFIPIVNKFTTITGKPLDFWFWIHPTIGIDNNELIFSGSIVFENGEKVRDSYGYLDMTEYIAERTKEIIEEMKSDGFSDESEYDIDVGEIWAEAIRVNDDGEYSIFQWFKNKI
jgi:hypothetical protein